MKEVQIEIPIDENGDFDVTKQREIAGKHKKIEEIKAKLKDNYEKMINSKVQIIEVEEWQQIIYPKQQVAKFKLL